jgi:hypothetical protein
MGVTRFVTSSLFGNPKDNARDVVIEKNGKTPVRMHSPYPQDATIEVIRKVRAPKLKKITKSPAF